MSALHNHGDPQQEPAEEATEAVSESAKLSAIRGALSREDQEHAFHAYYDEGHLTREEAEHLLGSSNLQIAEENAQGAEQMFQGDINRFF